jgi:Family of unknown function (DUF5686)/CarboxypepD_reg-like domain
MKNIAVFVFGFLAVGCFGQIKGTITDDKGNPLPYVNVVLENSYNSTSSNTLGKYELQVKTAGKQSIKFQFLGFKTQKIMVDVLQFPFTLDVVLQEEVYHLNEVVIDKKVNPAIAIIKNAIANRKENSDKTARFQADFYSRGMMKIKDLPKRIMGMKVDLGEDMASNLDSTGSGIIYLSETVSKIVFEKPNKLKEKIIASKIAGNDKGYSYNTARSTAYDFYENTLPFQLKMISPIADNAFNYYKYKLDGSFFDENNQQIFKIKVLPKRDKEPVFEGYIYLVDESFAIYAVDLDIKGYRMQNEFMEKMNVKQNFNYNANNKIWAKNSQSLDFVAGAFGIKFSGKFNYVFSNYQFQDRFDKKTFGNEIVSFEDNANKKDASFWDSNRPIPLTVEEKVNYIKKDSLQIIRKSQKYLDSIDKKHNKFSFSDILMGYSYRNSYQKHSFDYKGLLDISSFSFNTVQGYSLSSGFGYSNWAGDEKGKNTDFRTIFNYGFSEQRLRVSAEYEHTFNNQNYAQIKISGGTKVSQFNNANPILNIVNDVSTLFFKNNFMKLYNLEFAKINFSQDIANGINLNTNLEFQQRKPLFNNTDYSVINSDKPYTANNPIDPNDYLNAGFETQHLFQFGLHFKINFANKYLSRPDGKFNLRNRKYPTLFIHYEKTFAASNQNYNFDQLNTQVYYNLDLSNKGNLALNLKAGKLFAASNISFIDYKHFNGNQTHIGTADRYLNVFNLMPYYQNSTNDAYLETHTEYEDQGFIMNKIPLLNRLKSTLILGLHNLAVPNRSPYTEVTVGLNNLGVGKFKLFRLDYIRSFSNQNPSDGIIIGCKILNAFE